MKNTTTLNKIINTIITQFYIIGTGFILTIIITRNIGVETKGLLVTLQLIPALIISFFDLGIRQSTAFLYAKNNEHKSEIINTIIRLWVWSSLVSVILTISVIYIVYPSIWSVEYILPIIITIPFTLFTIYFRGVLQGKNEIIKINKARNIHQNIIILFILILWVMNFITLELILWIEMIAFFFMSFYMYNILKVEFGYLSFKTFKGRNNWLKDLVKIGITYSLSVFILRLNYKVDALLLSAMDGVKSVGVLSVGTTIAELIWQLPGAIGVVLFSRNLNSTAQQSTLRTVKLARVSLFLSIIFAFFLFIISPFIIPFLYGEEFKESSTVIRCLLPGIVFMVVFQILNSDMNAKGKPLIAFKIFLVGLFINVLLNIILIPIYSYNGAAIASSISYALSTCWYVYVYSKINQIEVRRILFVNLEDLKEIIGKVVRRKI